MKVLATLALAALIAAPEGWREESFRFPLQIAPSIPYEGEEHLRFAPDWEKFDTDRGFSYVFLWDIKRRELEPQDLERALRAYFDGLMEAVTKARKLTSPGTASTLSLHPMTPPKGWTAGFGGRLWTWNGFSKGERLVLHLEIALRHCGDARTQAFFAFSKAPREHAVWGELRGIREATTCA